jgi:hypothetical protein
MAWLTEFASTTPFQLDTVVESFIKMQALGLNPTEDALRSFGNTSAAMGKDLMQFIEAVADASVGEFERLKEFGVKSFVLFSQFIVLASILAQVVFPTPRGPQNKNA